MTKITSSSRRSSRLRRLTDILLGRTAKWHRKQAEARAVAIITPEFDREFYQRAHPQGTGGMDPVLHYVRHGCLELRDPSPNFSTRNYLLRYGDVRRSGTNPFEHYLANGRAEGRIADRSTRVMEGTAETPPNGNETTGIEASPRSAPISASAVATPEGEAPIRVSGPSRLAVLAIVDNQADIVRSFAAHVLQLFDEIVFVDRGSTDGTLEFLVDLAGRRRDVNVYRLDVAGEADAAAANHLIATAKELKGADWIFLLAADRFLPFADRAGLDAALADLADAAIVSLPSKTLVPEHYGEHDMGGRFFVADETAGRPSVAVRPSALSDAPYWVDPVAGAAAPFPGGEPLTARTGFDVLRLPLRSVDQLSLEIARRLAVTRPGEAGGAAGARAFPTVAPGAEVTPDLLDAIALSWNVEGAEAAAIPRADRIASGSLRPLETTPAMAEIDAAIGRPSRLADILLAIEGRAAARLEAPRSSCVIERLVTTADRFLRRAPDDRCYRYEALPAIPDVDPIFDRAPSSDEVFVREFLQATYWPIVDLTPTAWAGHIPFMYALVAAFRPRRFVELGSHHGASFFAFCHAARRTLLETSAVAIDCWEGDVQTGFYGTTVFDGFRATLEKYRPFARYERMFFDEAAKLFEDGSIDLLHIDGLHTYEAVKHDYETWLPKMSDRGLIIFHDINVYERDFGVWQFWEQLRTRHPTMEFRHSHGLGVAYVGKLDNTLIARAIGLFGPEGAWKGLLQHHLERVSESNLEVYRRRNEITSMMDRCHAEKASLQLAVAAQKSATDGAKAMIEILTTANRNHAAEAEALLRECLELARRR